jgi:hypothetical protein
MNRSRANINNTDNDVDRRNQLIRGYGTMVRQRVDVGRKPYLLTFMFTSLPGSPAAIVGQMRAEATRVFTTLITRVARRPTSPASVDLLPVMIAAPDMPVPKIVKPAADATSLNAGLHMHGLLLMPPRSRLKVGADEHFRDHQGLYCGDRSRLDRIDVRPITHTPELVVDYLLKSVRRGRVSYDDILILPRAVAELCS